MTRDDERDEERRNWHPAVTTLTRPRTLTARILHAARDSAGRMCVVVSVLLILGTAVDMPRVLLALVAVAGAGVVVAFGVRDLTAREVWR